MKEIFEPELSVNTSLLVGMKYKIISMYVKNQIKMSCCLIFLWDILV